MRISIFACAVMLLSFAGAAEGKSFAWCQVNGGKYQTYLSGIVEIEDGPGAFRALKTGPFGNGFRQYVQSSLDPQASELDCNKQESRFFAEDYIAVEISGNPGYKFVKTGWSGSSRTATAEHRTPHAAAGEASDAGLRNRR